MHAPIGLPQVCKDNLKVPMSTGQRESTALPSSLHRMDGWIPTVSLTVSQGLQFMHAWKTQHWSTKKNKPLCQAFAIC